MKKLTSSGQLNVLAAQIGNFIEDWGFKNIHGMIWTHLYLSPVPLSAQELITRIKVSKALISLSIRDLAYYQLITQTEESMNRKNKFYTANPDVFNAIRSVLETREIKMLGQIQQEFQLLKNFPGTLPTVDHSKLLLLGNMITGANEALAQLIQLSQIDPSFFKNMFQSE